MNVFEKLKDYRKIDLNIYVDGGMITHTEGTACNEYTIFAHRIEFIKGKGKYTSTFNGSDFSNMRVNMFIDERNGTRKMEVITSPYVLSLNIETARQMAPIYTLGAMSPSMFSRGERSYKITLKTTVNISASRLMYQINTNDMRIHASDLSHSILGTPFTVSDNRIRWGINTDNDNDRINGTMRGVLSYE